MSFPFRKSAGPVNTAVRRCYGRVTFLRLMVTMAALTLSKYGCYVYARSVAGRRGSEVQ